MKTEVHLVVATISKEPTVIAAEWERQGAGREGQGEWRSRAEVGSHGEDTTFTLNEMGRDDRRVFSRRIS